jgi:tRNA threonylcarbamoyladenosine biosynthesis protein TsaB
MLAIDTSSARAAVALVAADRVLAETVKPAGREFDVAAEVARLVPDPKQVESVLVALGPGSFTGLRQGIAFGVGLALSLQVPLLGIGTLELAAARARRPALALSDAGRGRLYWLAPDGRRGVGESAELPTEWPAVGWLRNPPEIAFLPEPELRSFGESVLEVREKAMALGYATVRPQYMEDLGRLV